MKADRAADQAWVEATRAQNLRNADAVRAYDKALEPEPLSWFQIAAHVVRSAWLAIKP